MWVYGTCSYTSKNNPIQELFRCTDINYNSRDAPRENERFVLSFPSEQSNGQQTATSNRLLSSSLQTPPPTKKKMQYDFC